jgi:hypothetical protein
MGKCWVSDNQNDTMSSLAKILNVSPKDLNKHFQNPTIHIGDQFDTSFFGLGNVPTIRDKGPAVVQVFLVSEPESTRDRFLRDQDRINARYDAWTARNNKALYDLMVPKCAEEHKCTLMIIYPFGLGPMPRVTFSGVGQVVGHGARHLTKLGLSQAEVEAAIADDVQTIAFSTRTGSFYGKVTVKGQTIAYRAYTLPDGTINVGTYYKP